MAEPLALVRLTESQIALAKAANGPRLRITHALLCGEFGRMFGTEKQCRKYFDVWRVIFAHLFDGSLEMDHREIEDFRTTFDIVGRLGEADMAPRRREIEAMLAELERPRRRLRIAAIVTAILASVAWMLCG